MIIQGKQPYVLELYAMDGTYDYLVAKIDVSHMDVDKITLNSPIPYTGDFAIGFGDGQYIRELNFNAASWSGISGLVDWINGAPPHVTIGAITGCEDLDINNFGIEYATIGQFTFPHSVQGCSWLGSYLTQTQVDGLLAACVRSEAEYGWLDMSGGNAAEPSTSGWADVDTLISRYWTVQVEGNHP